MPEPALSSVRELKALDNANGRPFASILIVKKLAGKTASNGNPFLSVEFGDRTGSFACTLFNDNPLFELFKGLREGGVVRIEGRIDYFQGRLSPRLAKAEPLTTEQLAAPGLLDNLVETAPEDPAELWREFTGYIDGIKQDEIRMTVRAVFDELGEAFRLVPAGIMMHHAYRHGLLEHTVHMARVGRALLPIYPEVDPDLAMAGILVHDIGKAIEYENGLVPSKTRRGLLQGHVVLGYQLVRKAGLKSKLDAGLLERLEHIVLSHQGELEYGAAVIAATPEAVFVSMVDNLDSRMGMVQRLLRQGGDDAEFSERHPGLGSQLLLRKPGSAATGG
ncbi:MAG TPA: HD domain-containing protein [Opitutaceae bacterium]|nr:HD domain-containing protein [Opitutaceae bacterium]